MTTKVMLLIAGLLLIGTTSKAQISEPAHELGLNFSSGLEFGLFYKYGTDRKLFRMQLLLMNGKHSQQDDDLLDQINAGFRLGYEGRTPIAKHLNFIYGVDIGMNISGSYKRVDNQGRYRSTTKYNPGVWLVLGANYVLKDHWIFSLEINPHFNYLISTAKEDNGFFMEDRTNVAISYGLNTSAAKFSIAYRFVGKRPKVPQNELGR